MRWPTFDPASARVRRLGLFGLVAFILLCSGLSMAATWPHPTLGDSQAGYPQALRLAYLDLDRSVREFEDAQSRAGVTLASDQKLQQALTDIELAAARGQFSDAQHRIRALNAELAVWRRDLTVKAEQPASVAPATPVTTGSLNVPIVLYHYTPANFEGQLVHLEQHGYTVVDLDQVAAAMNGGTALPDKPVVITFDDGFENQMQAFEILKRHNMKATFYIITSGVASKWCIGSGRRYNDPLQPPNGCGDAYLNWDQVRTLDASGLITIAAHTVDHQNLPGDSPEQQRFEIFESKAELERQIGHPVRHFAYPYGAYNQTTIDLVREAGFVTATTTVSGTYQPPGSLYTLRRIRDTLTLP